MFAALLFAFRALFHFASMPPVAAVSETSPVGEGRGTDARAVSMHRIAIAISCWTV
jgi:hypothetical protein